MGRRFGWLWAAYGTSALGTWLAFGAFPLIAVGVLRAGPAGGAALSAAPAAVGAAIAVPFGPWIELRRKCPVLIGLDLTRFAALAAIPVAYALGALTYVQLLLTAVLVAAADIGFRAASGAYLKTLLAGGDLLAANARLESTAWTATAVGPPPLGAAAIAFLGPVATVLADAVSHLLSALGIGVSGGGEPRPERRDAPERAPLLGWRHILSDPVLRPLFFNTVLFNGLLMATEPLLAVLMLDGLGFAPWQYGLALATPAVGGLLGARLARPLADRYGAHRVLLASGLARALWQVALAFAGRGTGGLLLVTGVQFGLILSCAVFNPLQATRRLERTPGDRVARTLTAWTVTTRATTALLTAAWGALGALLALDLQPAILAALPDAEALTARIATAVADARERGLTTLVLAGVSTSGAVLSTALDAADRDHHLHVLSDGVADPEPGPHEALLTGVLPHVAEVVASRGLRDPLRRS